MDSNLQAEIRACITELYRISSDLRTVAGDIQKSVQGIDTNDTVKALKKAADKYDEAAGKLQNIR